MSLFCECQPFVKIPTGTLKPGPLTLCACHGREARLASVTLDVAFRPHVVEVAKNLAVHRHL